MGLLWGKKTLSGVKVGGLHIPKYKTQAHLQCVVGNPKLAEAASWGTSLGG